MTKSSKIFTAVFALALVGLSTYGYFLFQGRNSDSKTMTNDSKQQTQTDSFADQTSSASPTDPIADNSAVDSLIAIDNENTPDEKTNFLDVSKSDCENLCKDFTDPTDLKYCQEICGLNPIKKETEKKGCDSLKDLEKDYCLRDLAITKKDISICTEISDTNILKTCKNHIAQDLIESQK